MGREELAPGVVGGLLISYHLRAGLGGAPSIEGGTKSGCEASVMESCTRTTFGALLRAEGDGVLAPRVVAMADDSCPTGVCLVDWCSINWCTLILVLKRE